MWLAQWRPVFLLRVAPGRMLVCGVPVSGLFSATLCVWVPVGMLPRPTQRRFFFSPRVLIVSVCMLHWWVDVLWGGDGVGCVVYMCR
jgi:hypothetical protein